MSYFIGEVLLVPHNKCNIDIQLLTNELKADDLFFSNSVYVGQSLISGAGEGLFAQTEAEANTVMAFYNGVRITHSEVCVNQSFVFKYKMAYNTKHCFKLIGGQS